MPDPAIQPPVRFSDDLYAEGWESDEVLTEADIAKARRIAALLFPEDDDAR